MPSPLVVTSGANDGYMVRSSSTWADCRSGTGTGNGSTVLAAYGYISGSYGLHRSLVPFDTAGTPDDATVTQMDLALTAKDYNTPGMQVHIVTTANTGLSNAGYEIANWGTVSAGSFGPTVANNTEYSSAIDIGIITISKTGTTYIGLRGDDDLDNITPTDTRSNNWYVSEDAAGVRPRLSVAYTVGGPKFWMLEGRT